MKLAVMELAKRVVVQVVQVGARVAVSDAWMAVTAVLDVEIHVLERVARIAVAVVADAQGVVRLVVQTVALMVATTVVRAVAQVLV